jgi:hypothetical protein
MENDIRQWFVEQGVPADAAAEVVALLPKTMPEAAIGFFYTEEYVRNPDKWFFCPDQNRFVLVGQCTNGDGIAIDTQANPGAVYYVCHDRVHQDCPIEDMVVSVASSPGDFAHAILEDDSFPADFWDAKEANTEQNPGS